MDVSSVATSAAQSATAQGVSMNVMKAAQNLDKTVGSMLANSLGLGRNVDASA